MVFPLLLTGMGIGVWNPLKSVRVVARCARGFLGQEPPDEGRTPSARRRLLLVRGVAALLLVLGGVGWFGGAFAMLTRPEWLSGRVELPLGDLSGIAVDGQGRIYCGSPFYGRVQVYDADGRFLRGWFVDAGGGAFRLRVSPADELEVAAPRGSMYFRFDAEGNVLEEEADVPDYFVQFGEEGERRCRDVEGNTYTICWALLFPHIVRQSPDGTRATVVSTPAHNWIIMGPFPAWLLWAAGIVLLVVTNAWFRRQWKRAFRRRGGEGCAAEAAPADSLGA